MLQALIGNKVIKTVFGINIIGTVASAVEGAAGGLIAKAFGSAVRQDDRHAGRERGRRGGQCRRRSGLAERRGLAVRRWARPLVLAGASSRRWGPEPRSGCCQADASRHRCGSWQQAREADVRRGLAEAYNGRQMDAKLAARPRLEPGARTAPARALRAGRRGWQNSTGRRTRRLKDMDNSIMLQTQPPIDGGGDRR